MSEQDLRIRAEAAAALIRARVGEIPRVAVVLGSGLGGLVDKLAGSVIIPYKEIPHYPLPTVAGHAGNFVVGKLDGALVALLQGRFHFYEGYSLEMVAFPVRVLRQLGVHTLILTAAVGGISANLAVGDIVCVVDHLNLLGRNPLRGPNDERLGPRFPDMTEVYSRRLTQLAAKEARPLDISLEPAIYACMSGPSYETPAEIRMLRTLGADVVGMSTVPEAIVARHAGIEVLAFALVTNAAAGITGAPISHQEVLDIGRQAAEKLSALIGRVVAQLDEIGDERPSGPFAHQPPGDESAS